MQPWCQPAEVPELEAISGIDPEEVCAASSELLYVLSGRQFGIGTTGAMRPAHLDHDCGCLPWWAYSSSSYGWMGMTWPDGRMFPGGWMCGCASQKELILRGRNVRDLTVKVDGAVLDSSEYRLYSGRRLVRNNAAWPCCQRLDLPDTEAGTWSVQYTWGTQPPLLGRLASRSMALELGKVMSCDSDESQLPARVTTIARQGVTAIVQEPLSVLRDGFTGIALVDQFLVAYNPGKLRRQARVLTPDTVQNYMEAP